MGLRKWVKSELGPFDDNVESKFNKKSKSKDLKSNVDRVVGMWEKGKDGSYNIKTYDVSTVNEWIEITKDTLLEDIAPNTKYVKKESLRNIIKKVLREEFKKPLN